MILQPAQWRRLGWRWNIPASSDFNQYSCSREENRLTSNIHENFHLSHSFISNSVMSGTTAFTLKLTISIYIKAYNKTLIAVKKCNSTFCWINNQCSLSYQSFLSMHEIAYSGIIYAPSASFKTSRTHWLACYTKRRLYVRNNCSRIQQLISIY